MFTVTFANDVRSDSHGPYASLEFKGTNLLGDGLHVAELSAEGWWCGGIECYPRVHISFGPDAPHHIDPQLVRAIHGTAISGVGDEENSLEIR